MKKIITFLILFHSISNFSQTIEKQEDNTIYNAVEVKPEFPGGMEKLNSYINENLQKAGFKTETETKEKPKVYVMFVVEKDGSLSDIKILRAGSAIAAELVTIFKNMPKWNPGKQNGKIVRVLYTLPVVSGT